MFTLNPDLFHNPCAKVLLIWAILNYHSRRISTEYVAEKTVC